MIAPEGLLPNLGPAARVEASRPSAPHEQEALGERARFNEDLKKALKMVWGANRSLIDRDYADPEAINKEESHKSASKDDLKVLSDSRKKEQETARIVIDGTKTENEIKTAVSEQMRASDPHWKDVVLTDENKAEFDQAVTAEIVRRKSLITMAETLYGVEDCRAAASREFTAASDKKLSDKIAAAKAAALTEAQAKDSTITTLSPEVISKIEAENKSLSDAEITAIEAEIGPKYSSGERVFHRVKRGNKQADGTYIYTIEASPDGKPIPVDEISAYQPLVEAVDNLAAERVAGKPTTRATEAAKLRETFKLNADGQSFNLRSQERMNEIEALQDFDLVAEACGQEISKLMDGVLGDLIGEDRATSLLVVDKDGKIIDVNPDFMPKLQELLKGRNPDDKTYALFQLTQQLGAYLENRNSPNGADPDKGQRIATTLFYSLQNTAPELKVAFNKPDRFKTNMQVMVQEMIDQYFEGRFPTGGMNTIMEKNPLRLLSLALRLRDEKMIAYSPSGAVDFKNSKGLHQIIADWKLDKLDQQFVLQFASNDSLIETALEKNFGLDANTLQDPEVQQRHIEAILEHIVPQRVNDPDNKENVDKVKSVYRTVLTDTLSDETLEKIRKEHKLGGVLKAIGMIALILGPGAQGILGLDVSDDEQNR